MFIPKLSLVRKIQLDHTSRCNLACPQCARTDNDRYNIADLSVDDYKIILEPFEDNQIKFFHNGNFGDAIVSPTFNDTFDFYIDKIREIDISTNGSMRTPDWWARLAQQGSDKLTVIFSIDGLKDTNHLYRVGSNYNKIIENATAFINAGGAAEWHFIEFGHNQHQAVEAHNIAKQMGFTKFVIKNTARFAELNTTFVENKKKKIIYDKVDNPRVQDKADIVKKYKTMKNYTKSTDIFCKSRFQQTLFVDMNMDLWPCCWFGSPPYASPDSVQRKDFENIFKKYGRDFMNLRKHGWKAFEHEFFQEYLSASWSDPKTRIYTCGRTCGKDFSYSGGDKSNQKVNIL